MILARLHALWRNLASRARVEQALEAELRSTVDLLIDEKIRAGVTPTAARRLATLELGGIELVKERARDAHVALTADAPSPPSLGGRWRHPRHLGATANDSEW